MHITIDIQPVIDAIALLLGDAAPQELNPALAEKVLSVFVQMVEVGQIDRPKALEFYQQIGFQVAVLLVRRAASEKIANDLLNRLNPN